MVILFPHPQLVRKRERAIGIESEMREKKEESIGRLFWNRGGVYRLADDL